MLYPKIYYTKTESANELESTTDLNIYEILAFTLKAVTPTMGGARLYTVNISRNLTTRCTRPFAIHV